MKLFGMLAVWAGRGWTQWQGQLPGDEETHEVTLDITGIIPGSYWFVVRAVNGAGGASQRG
jgi:hypothetical protein